MSNFIIAIDGPAGSGKSTVAKLLSERLGFERLNTGAIYRSFAFHHGNSSLDPDQIEKSLKSFDLIIKENGFFLKGKDITQEIHHPDIAKIASQISQISQVRKFLLPYQRKLAENKSCVVEGRDIGSVVFPHSHLKIFLTASITERAKRRQDEFPSMDLQKIQEEIRLRDSQDSNRDIAPLIKTPDAIEINSDQLDASEVADLIIKKFHEKIQVNK